MWDELARLAGSLKPAVIVHQGTGAAVTRWGKYHRDLSPGFHWTLPLAEHVYTRDTAETLETFEASLTTRDGEAIILGYAVRYQIDDVGAATFNVCEFGDSFRDAAKGAAAEAIFAREWGELIDAREAIVAEITAAVQEIAEQWGASILGVSITDLAPVHCYRHFGASPTLAEFNE